MKESSKIAVILFAYKRPRYLRKAIKTHKKVEGLKYFAFIDYSEMQKKIYEIIDEANIYDVIYRKPENLGLNESIKRGIQYVFDLGYDAVIVLEDDLLLGDDAIEYLVSGLKEFYSKVQAISCVKGEMEDRFKCWAWGTWRGVWENINWDLKPDKKNRDSWDMIVAENFRVKNWACRCSKFARVKHIGWAGVHYSYLDLFSVRRIWRSIVNYFG